MSRCSSAHPTLFRLPVSQPFETSSAYCTTRTDPPRSSSRCAHHARSTHLPHAESLIFSRTRWPCHIASQSPVATADATLCAASSSADLLVTLVPTLFRRSLSLSHDLHAVCACHVKPVPFVFAITAPNPPASAKIYCVSTKTSFGRLFIRLKGP